MARGKGFRKPPSQRKPPLTHFLCLPLVTGTSKPQLEASISSFRDDVAPSQGDASSGNDTASVHPKAIRPVGALHCTLGVMSLDQDGLEKAIGLLKALDVGQLLPGNTSSESGSNAKPPDPRTESSIEEKKTQPITLGRPISPPRQTKPSSSSAPIKIDLKGLASMHAPQKTSILYIDPLDPSERLYPFCVALQKLFKDGDFLVPDDRKLNLHATIVNTIYAKGRKGPIRPKRTTGQQHVDSQSSGSTEQARQNDDDRSQGHGPNANAPLKMDATALLEKYKDFVWAENVTLDRIAICEMGAKKKMDENGNVVSEEYTEVASIPLPV